MQPGLRCLAFVSLVGLASLLALTACTERQFGSGIGRPPAGQTERPALQPLLITEVYAGDTVTPAFVELAVAGDATVTEVPLTGLWLCTERSACVELGAAQAALPAGDRLRVDATTLGLVAQYGQVAVVDADLAAGAFAELAHAHLAWGGEPPATSPLTGPALTSGAFLPGEHVALPYPVPAGVAVAAEAAGLGCAAPSPEAVAVLDPALCTLDDCEVGTCAPSACDPSACDPAACALSGPALRLTEVAITATETWIDLQNCTNADLPLYGVRVCQPPSCARFEAGDLIPAPGTGGLELALPGAAPLRADGEIAVLAPGAAAIAEVAALLSFVSYGEADPELAPAAAAAALWTGDGTTAPSLGGGQALTRIDGAAGPSSWELAAPVAAPADGTVRVLVGSGAP